MDRIRTKLSQGPPQVERCNILTLPSNIIEHHRTISRAEDQTKHGTCKLSSHQSVHLDTGYFGEEVHGDELLIIKIRCQWIRWPSDSGQHRDRRLRYWILLWQLANQRCVNWEHFVGAQYTLTQKETTKNSLCCHCMIHGYFKTYF